MLEALGNLGDFVGGLAVVVTLVYLAVQVRQNTVQLRKNVDSAQLSARAENNEAMSRFRSQIVGSPSVASIFLKGRSDRGSLTPEERIRFDMLLLELFSTFQSAEVRARYLGDDESRLKPTLRAMLERPGTREWWEASKSQFRPEFVSLVDSELVPPSRPDA